MELAEWSVGRRLKQEHALSPSEAAQVVIATVDALAYLHKIGCPHRDVKPDNILRVGDVYKLGDLGIVKWTDFDRRFTTGGTITRSSMQIGSWFYMAPEQQQDPHEAVPESDLYALGISFIEMLTGQVPAPQAVGAGQYAPPCDSERVCDTIRRMVSYRPSDRPALVEIRETAETLLD
jgi:serine/threonine-protein kinase